MTIRVAINGLGRIGRTILRALYEYGQHPEIQIVAINELAKPDAIVHLLKYDSSHGKFRAEVKAEQDALLINGDSIALYHEADINKLPWRHLNVDLVFECTGVFGLHQELLAHISAGAKKVLLSHPGAPDMDFTVIFGINDKALRDEHVIVSNGSCTTNCVIPLIHSIDQQFGVESGAITTIHASMNDQKVIDSYHDDFRRSRAASHSIIPVDTKLALGIERILPHLQGRFEAIAVRVPTINVTAMDVSLTVNADVNRDQINACLKQAQSAFPRQVLRYTEEPLVSVDFVHDPNSCIVDGSLTRVSHKRLVKSLIWCDNEWGFANRMLDVARLMFPGHITR